MKEMKDYKELESDNGMMAEEPIVAYGEAELSKDSFCLPEDVVIGAVKYAEIARNNNRMVLHQDVEMLINNKMGWK